MHLRILTYNIHKCIGGLDRRFDPERVRATIAHYHPDLVLMQEVDNQVPRSKFHSLCELLGDLLHLRHRSWFPNVEVRGGGTYGNAVLSRFPIFETQNIDLTIPPRKRRSVLHARCRVRLPSGTQRTLHVYNLHLGLSGAERKKQLQRFLASHPFAGLDHRAPILVAGDFNDVWASLGRDFLVPAGFRGQGRPIATFPAWAPLRPLDSVYVRGRLELVEVHRARVASARYASDHLPLVADVRIV
jgi:endonuclease/exonuclease/phosphatase family metal-dependent hydrolase